MPRHRRARRRHVHTQTRAAVQDERRTQQGARPTMRRKATTRRWMAI